MWDGPWLWPTTQGRTGLWAAHLLVVFVQMFLHCAPIKQHGAANFQVRQASTSHPFFDGARRAAQSLRQLGFIKKSIAGDGRVCWLGLNLHSIVCLVIGGVDSANFMSKNKEAQKLTLRPRQRGYLLAPLFAQSRHVPQLQHYMNVRVRLDLEKQLQPQNKRGWSVVGQPRWQCHKRRQF